jgi:hypothetical protein
MADKGAKWNEQAFLIDFFEQWLPLQETHEYKNFTQITGDNSGIVNHILAKPTIKSTQTFFKLSNSQQSLLVPQIRIFKVKYDKSVDEFNQVLFENPKMVEFKFNESTTVDSILKTTRERGSDVGIKSFTWEDLGTNPADSGLAFKAELKLYFQSVDAIFTPRSDGVKFADLFIPPGGPAGVKVDSENNKHAYEDQDFQIKAIVGWATPNDANNTLLRPHQISAIKQQKVSLLLTLYDHTLDFKQDGSVDVSLSYMAAIEGRMNHSDTDLLYVDSGQRKEVIILKKGEKSLKELKERRTELKNRINKLEKGKKTGVVFDSNDLRLVENAGAEQIQKEAQSKAPLSLFQSGGSQKAKDKYKEIVHLNQLGRRRTRKQTQQREALLAEVGEDWYKSPEGMKKRLEEEGKELESVNAKIDIRQAANDQTLFDLRSKSYSRLLRLIAEKQRIFTIKLDEQQIETWKESLERYSEFESKKTQNDKIVQNRLSSKDKIKKRFGDGALSNRSEVSSELAKWNTSLVNSDSSGRQGMIDSFLKKSGPSASADTEIDYNRDGLTGIKFFFFGDIIEAAIDIVTAGKNDKIIDTPRYKSDLKKEIKLILGAVPMYFYDNDGKIAAASVPMSDIPISLEYFNAWFVKNVIKPLKDHYYLRDFINDLAKNLIDNALSPMTFGPIGELNQSTISFSTFALPFPKDAPDVFKAGKLDRSQIKQVPSYDNDHGGTILRQYFLMYYNSGMSKKMLGRERPQPGKADDVGDTGRGILHFKFGSQQGIVKKMTFAKQDIQGAREARILKAQKSASKNLLFSNKYDCNVTLYGTTMFKPGMLVYVDPTSLGIPNQENIARNMGLGGYYSIVHVENISESGKFETNLRMVFEGAANSSDHNEKPYGVSISKLSSQSVFKEYGT